MGRLIRPDKQLLTLSSTRSWAGIGLVAYERYSVSLECNEQSKDAYQVACLYRFEKVS